MPCSDDSFDYIDPFVSCLLVSYNFEAVSEKKIGVWATRVYKYIISEVDLNSYFELYSYRDYWKQWVGTNALPCLIKAVIVNFALCYFYGYDETDEDLHAGFNGNNLWETIPLKTMHKIFLEDDKRLWVWFNVRFAEMYFTEVPATFSIHTSLLGPEISEEWDDDIASDDFISELGLFGYGGKEKNAATANNNNSPSYTNYTTSPVIEHYIGRRRRRRGTANIIRRSSKKIKQTVTGTCTKRTGEGSARAEEGAGAEAGARAEAGADRNEFSINGCDATGQRNDGHQCCMFLKPERWDRVRIRDRVRIKDEFIYVSCPQVSLSPSSSVREPNPQGHGDRKTEQGTCEGRGDRRRDDTTASIATTTTPFTYRNGHVKDGRGSGNIANGHIRVGGSSGPGLGGRAWFSFTIDAGIAAAKYGNLGAGKARDLHVS